MALDGDCTKIISDLADEYQRSACLLAELEECLQRRTRGDQGVHFACDEQSEAQDQLSSFKANLGKLQIDDDENDSILLRESSRSLHGEHEGSDAEIDAELAALRQNSVRSGRRRSNYHESPNDVQARRALSVQPSRRSLRRTSTVLLQWDPATLQSPSPQSPSSSCSQLSPLALQPHPPLLQPGDSRRRLSCSSHIVQTSSSLTPTSPVGLGNANLGCCPSSSPQLRVLSESQSAISFPDLNQRRCAADRKTLALNGAPLVPSTLSRAYRSTPTAPSPLRSDSAVSSRGPHALVAWTSGAASGGGSASSSPVGRSQPLFRKVPELREEEAEGDDGDSRDPFRLQPSAAARRGDAASPAPPAAAFFPSRRGPYPTFCGVNAAAAAVASATRSLQQQLLPPQRRVSMHQEVFLPQVGSTAPEASRASLSNPLPPVVIGQGMRSRRQTEVGVSRPGTPDGLVVLTPID